MSQSTIRTASASQLSLPVPNTRSSSSLKKSVQPHANVTPSQSQPSPSNAEAIVARNAFLKIFVGGVFMVIILIFTIFPIFWGSLWKTPEYNLHGWIVDFDGGVVGEVVTKALLSSSLTGKITWTNVTASNFPFGLSQLENVVVDEKTWVAVTINEGTSARLSAALAIPNASYDAFEAITAFGVEARNENAYRSIILPTVEASLQAISTQFALQNAKNIPSANIAALLMTSPQTLVTPVSYTIRNLVPFDEPVATAVTFVGLLYQLILSFFVVMIGNTARHMSGFDRHLSFRALLKLRFASVFGAYFIISLFYSLLTVAFQLDFTRKFGRGGFLVFWMLQYVGMLAVGLALESMITLLTTSFIAFFMLTWIITNVSVSIFPIETLPRVFRYGYAAPFYNVSKAVRTIVFGTKNNVGVNFAILIIWIVISCITLPLFQWLMTRKSTRNSNETQEAYAEKMQEV